MEHLRAQTIPERGIALSGNTLVVGAFEEDSAQNYVSNDGTASSSNTSGSAGAVYVFNWNASNWSQTAFIKPSNARALQRFGMSIALANNIIAVGAPEEASSQRSISNGLSSSCAIDLSQAGAAYAFNWQP